MKIIIDECLPKKLCSLFVEHDAYTVPQLGLAGTQDGELLNALEARQIDVFVTIDGNIEYQQQFMNRTFATIVIRSVSNRFEDLIPLQLSLKDAIKSVKKGTVVRIP
jgi:predicted nuclease of predicted toxin-antitoxin system